MNNKVLNIYEAIALHKGNAEFFKQTGEEIQMQNELNLVEWLSELLQFREFMKNAVAVAENPTALSMRELFEPVKLELDYSHYRNMWQDFPCPTAIVNMIESDESEGDTNGQS